jgi:rhodanese-related sulfurtransferase
MAHTSINRQRTTNAKWIAAGALILSLLCSCRSSSGPASLPPARDASDRIKEVSTSQLKDWMSTGQPLTPIDVREENEWQAGHAATAIHIPRMALPGAIGTAVPDKTARIVLYCLGGVRSAAAAGALQKMGYTNVFSLTGGFMHYQLEGLPIQK